MRIFERSGALHHTLEGFRPIIGLADGAFVVSHHYSEGYPGYGGPFFLRDVTGKEHALPDVIWRPSPDGRFLGYTSFDGDTPVATVWDVTQDAPLTLRDALVGG